MSAFDFISKEMMDRLVENMMNDGPNWPWSGGVDWGNHTNQDTVHFGSFAPGSAKGYQRMAGHADFLGKDLGDQCRPKPLLNPEHFVIEHSAHTRAYRAVFEWRGKIYITPGLSELDLMLPRGEVTVASIIAAAPYWTPIPRWEVPDQLRHLLPR